MAEWRSDIKQLFMMLTDCVSGIQGGESRDDFFLCLNFPPPPRASGQDLKSSSGRCAHRAGGSGCWWVLSSPPCGFTCVLGFLTVGGWFQGWASQRWRAKPKLHAFFCDPASGVTKRLLAHVLLVGAVTRPRPNSKGGNTDPTSQWRECQWHCIKSLWDVCTFHSKCKRLGTMSKEEEAIKMAKQIWKENFGKWKCNKWK